MIENSPDGIVGYALEAQKKIHIDETDPEATKLAKQLVAGETQGQGSIGSDTYLVYFHSMGGLPFWFSITMAFFSAQVLQIGLNAWIKDWASSDDRQTRFAPLFAAELSTQVYLEVYCVIAALYCFGVAARVGINFFGSLTASRLLYEKVLRRILSAKMRWVNGGLPNVLAYCL